MLRTGHLGSVKWILYGFTFIKKLKLHHVILRHIHSDTYLTYTLWWCCSAATHDSLISSCFLMLIVSCKMHILFKDNKVK